MIPRWYPLTWLVFAMASLWHYGCSPTPATAPDPAPTTCEGAAAHLGDGCRAQVLEACKRVESSGFIAAPLLCIGSAPDCATAGACPVRIR